jgi:hypothetical protein
MDHPKIGEDKIPLDEALKAAGVEMNEAEREAFGDWIMERHGIGHGKHYTRHPASLDTLRGDVKDFRAERSTKKTGGGGSPQGGHGTITPPVTKPDGSGTSKGHGDGGKATPESPAEPASSGHADVKSAEQKFVDEAETVHKLSKDPKLDVGSVSKQTAALEAEAETLAAQLRKHPEMADISGSTAKEFFAGVRGKFRSVRVGGGSIVLLALNIANAYALVQEVRSILTSKTLKEGLQKTINLGKGIAKGYIEFGVLKFVFRSTPIAIGIQVFLGDMDMNLGLGPNGKFDMEIAKLVNQVQPDSVQPAFHADNMTNFKDADAKKLFMETREEAIKELNEQIATGTTQMGYGDGLTGSKAKKSFEVSDMEAQVLRINAKWMEQNYVKGFSKGDGEKASAVKRAKQAGMDAGKAGKESNFLALANWPELEAVRQRSFDKEVQADFDFQKVWDEYKSAYDQGYAEGRKSDETKTVEKFQIGERSITAQKYGRRPLYAKLVYSNGTDSVVSEGVEWSIDKPLIADIAFDPGAKATFAQLIGVGSAKIKAKFVSGGRTFDDSIPITVTEPKIRLVPEAGSYEVGARTRFVARTDEWPALPAGSIVWSTDPPGIVDIDQDGNAHMLKAGDTEIVVMESETSPIRVTAKIKVAAKR